MSSCGRQLRTRGHGCHGLRGWREARLRPQVFRTNGPFIVSILVPPGDRASGRYSSLCPKDPLLSKLGAGRGRGAGPRLRTRPGQEGLAARGHLPTLHAPSSGRPPLPSHARSFYTPSVVWGGGDGDFAPGRGREDRSSCQSRSQARLPFWKRPSEKHKLSAPGISPSPTGLRDPSCPGVSLART